MTQPPIPVVSGPAHVLLGFRLLARPGLRRSVLVPLLVNSLLFSLGFWAAFAGLEGALDHWLGDSLHWLRWLLLPLLGLILLIISFYSFTLVANLLLAPFNGALARKVEQLLTGKTLPAPERGIWGEVAFTLKQESRRLLLIVLLLAGVFVLGLIPLVGVVAAPLGLLLGAWLLAMDFSGNACSNWGWTLAEQRSFIGRYRWTFIGFGFAVMGLALVPIVNFALLPAAVAGSTALCVRLRDVEAGRSGDA